MMSLEKPKINNFRNDYEKSFFWKLRNEIVEKGHALFVHHEHPVWYFSEKGERRCIRPDFIIHGNTDQVRVVVEIDGVQHQKKDARIHDHMRDSTLKDLGYTILRFTSDEINSDIGRCISRVSKVLYSVKIEAIKAAQRRKMYQSAFA